MILILNNAFIPIKRTLRWFSDIKRTKRKRVSILAIFLLIALLSLGTASLLITVVEPIKAAVANGIIVGWPSTNASIPSGWSRVTDLDDKYVKGTADSTDPNNTGGATTHTHTSPSHNHSISSHTHSVSVPIAFSATGTYNNGQIRIDQDHIHPGSTSSSASGTSGGTVATYQVANNDPSYYNVIYIQSDGTPTGIPDNALAFYNSSSPPTDWIQNVGSKDRFLKGATGGGDGGGTGGGTHAHNADAHNHTKNHSHGGNSANNSTVDSTAFVEGGTGGSANPHTHVMSLSSSGNVPNATSGNTGDTTYEPQFHTLLVIENDKGTTSLPNSTIAMWLGTLASIPTDWVLCDGTGDCTADLRDKFIKAANVGGDVGTTGGTDGHDHSDSAGHTHAAHGHETTFAATTSQSHVYESPFNVIYSKYVHTHASTTSDSDGTTDSTTQTVDTTTDTQPPFRTVAYIKCVECSNERRVMLISYIMPFLPPIDQGAVIAFLTIIMASLIGYLFFNALTGSISLHPSRNISL